MCGGTLQHITVPIIFHHILQTVISCCLLDSRHCVHEKTLLWRRVNILMVPNSILNNGTYMDDIYHKSGGKPPLLSARPTIIFPAAECHCPFVSKRLHCLLTMALASCCKNDKNNKAAETCLRPNLWCINNRSTFCRQGFLDIRCFWGNSTTSRWWTTGLLHIIHHHLVKAKRLNYWEMFWQEYFLLQNTLIYYFNHIHPFIKQMRQQRYIY